MLLRVSEQTHGKHEDRGNSASAESNNLIPLLCFGVRLILQTNKSLSRRCTIAFDLDGNN